MLRLWAAVAVCAAAGSACARPPNPPNRTESLAAVDVLLRPETETIEAVVPRHATLDSLLRAHDFTPELIHAAVSSAAAVFDPRHLRADRPYRLVRSLDGWLREFVYEIDADRFLRIVNPDRSRPQVLDASVVPFDKATTVAAVRGAIDAARPSLIAALEGTGEKLQLAIALAGIFSGQIDFDRELQPGDGFDVLFEKSTRATGEFAGYGAILGATFVADGKEYHAIRWVDPATGKAAYYDAAGRSLRRFFLMSPLKFEPRVTSHFSRSRLHPVHRDRRPHLGVDYGAPHGAPVVAVANGTVVSAGWAAAAATRSTCATREASRRITCTCRRSRGGSARARASTRGMSSAGSAAPAPRPARTSTSGCARRAPSWIRSASGGDSRRASRSPRFT